jgi:hypothetical protein
MRLFLLMSLVAFSAVAQEAVVVEKAKVTVEYKRFDPQRLPDPAPPLHAGEAAVTVYQYGVETDMRYSYAGPPPAKGAAVKLDFKMERMTVKLNLTVTIWLPEKAGERLTAHEEGHRAIAERFYADADKTARKLAEKVVGKSVRGEGDDVDAAGRNAIARVNQGLCDEYLKIIGDPCDKAQTAFDRLTDHGRKEKPAAKEAVEMAVTEGKK